MPLDRPTPAELLAAVREHLDTVLAPTLEGQPAFHLRVASNVIAIVERSLAGGAQMDAAELSRLEALLAAKGSLLSLNQELCRRIRAGEMDDRRAALLEHLRQTAVDKLALADPRYLTRND